MTEKEAKAFCDRTLEHDQEQNMILDTLEQILDDYNNGIDISYSELVFLQEHQDTIKEYFWDNPTLWELAGIPEQDWTQ